MDFILQKQNIIIIIWKKQKKMMNIFQLGSLQDIKRNLQEIKHLKGKEYDKKGNVKFEGDYENGKRL